MLGLPMEKPTQDFYELIKGIHQAIDQDIQSSARLDPPSLLGGLPEKKYRYTRALVESVGGGSDAYLTEGTYSSVLQNVPNTPTGVPAIRDIRSFEGWKHLTR